MEYKELITVSDLLKFAEFLESKPLRKYSEGWRRITNDPNDEPLNFKSLSDLEVIEWFKRENK
jgi:hypothetical protein